MYAALLMDINEPLQLHDTQLDDPLDREVRVRIAATGVCHSDRHAYSGGVPGMHLPCLLGHESAGVVTEVGRGVTNFRAGDHVVISPAGSCGICAWCSRGHPQHCMHLVRTRGEGHKPRISLEGRPVAQFAGIGGFAEEVLVQDSSLALIPKAMPLDMASLLGCAVTTGIGAVRHSANVQLGQTVAVIGCGGVGLSAIQGARLTGADRIIAIDRIQAKLDIAQALGATDLVNASQTDPVAAVMELTGGVNHAIESVGNRATTQQAFQMLSTRGVATIVGLSDPDGVINLPAYEFLQEKVIQGSRLGGTSLRIDIPLYAQWYLDGRLDLDSLMGETIDLGSVAKTFAQEAASDLARTVIKF